MGDEIITNAVTIIRHDLPLGLGPAEEPPLDLYAYQAGQEIIQTHPPFASLIYAALYRADSTNARILRAAFPRICGDAQARYDAPGGILPGEQEDTR